MLSGMPFNLKNMKRFDSENIFKSSLERGCNLFIGAGFSIYAKNNGGNCLPIGSDLLSALKKEYDINLNLSLPQISTIIEKKSREKFHSFLRNLYLVESFDERYINIDKLNPKKIYTTNIDNLVHKIYEKIDEKYINDVTYEGESIKDEFAVDFSALHGNVIYKDRPMIFDVASINNAYAANPRIWNHLSLDFEKRITLFWGYSVNDTAVIQSLTSNLSLQEKHKEKWIIIHPSDKDSSLYYESLGFNIIISDTNEFLDYLKNFKPTKTIKINSYKLEEDENQVFGHNLVPFNTKKIAIRPIGEFFSGFPPTWSDIFSNQIYKTNHFRILKDAIYSGSHIIIQGAPVSGKTTLMMQLAADVNKSRKLIFDNLTINKAKLIVEILNDIDCLIFIDNFTDSLEAFNYLINVKNIQVVGVDRSHNFSIISHMIETNYVKIFDVTRLTDSDYQGIFDKLPTADRTDKLNTDNNKIYDKDTLYEFVLRNVKSNTIIERFKNVLSNLKGKDPRLTEFLVLTAYVHSCRIPISFDMLYSYFYDEIDSFHEIYDLRDHLSDLIKDYSGDLDLDIGDQDYYFPRSYYVAESILKLVDSYKLREVMSKALNNIPSTQIPFYSTFKKYAYDKNLVLKAFFDWNEGKEFYERAYDMDFKNPFVLQQGALYLAAKKKYQDAFSWIDKAITKTNNIYFSIRNSHAIILFDANINTSASDELVRPYLDKSMDILEKCLMADKRKIFHAIRYSSQALEYSKRFNDEKAIDYLKKAKGWLENEISLKKWDRAKEMNGLLKEIESILIY